LIRILRTVLIIFIAAFAFVYLVDWAAFRFHIPKDRELYSDVRVDQVYTDTNKYNETEYSRGNPVMERCVYSLFPHGGMRPCWYVQSHTMNVTNTG
jgi:hypothetical protein